MIDFHKMTSDELRKLYIMKEKEEILAKYHLPEKPSKDGYYHIRLIDAEGRRTSKQATAKTIEALKEKIYAHEKGATGGARKTFKDAFTITQEFKLKYVKKELDKESRKGTIQKNWFDYQKFIEGTAIENRFMDEITKKDIEAIIFQNLDRYDLTHSRYMALRGVLSSTFKTAYEEEWIKDNPYTRVRFEKFSAMIADTTPIEERTFSDIEMHKIHARLEEIHEQRPHQMTAWAVDLAMLVFFRSGELPALKWEDIHEDYISVNKEQIKTVEGEYLVVPHTKTKYNRKFPITKKIRRLLERIREVDKQYYPNSPYLFPNLDGTDCVRKKGIYDVFNRICKQCNIELSKAAKKGVHALRRVGATHIIQKTRDRELESKLLGHSPEVAGENYITDDEYDMKKAAEILEAIGF